MKKMNLQFFAEPELPVNPVTPEMNWETSAHINTTPSAEQPTWSDMGALMKNMAQALNEVLAQQTYWKDKGYGSTEVVGMQLSVTITGDVKPEDDACTYLLSDAVLYGIGNARKSHLKLVKGDKVIIWPITFANITPAYGDSGAINALTITIHGNGRPAIGTTEAL